MLLDLDADSVPEILFPERQSDESDLLAEDCEAPLRTGAFGDRIDSEYRRLASRWLRANFDYGSARPGTINLFVTDSVRVFSFVGADRWAQSRYPEHLRWRIDILSEARASASATCQAQLADVIGYLRSELAAP